MIIYSPSISGSLSFENGTNSIGESSANLTGSFSGSLTGTMTVTGDIVPNVSGAYDLGSAELPFRDIYVSQNSLKFISTESGEEIGRISVNKNTGDIKLLNTKRLTPEQRATLTGETVTADAISPVSASALWVSQSISPGHTNTSIGHSSQKFHTLHTQFISASSSTLTGNLHVGDTVIASAFTGTFNGAISSSAQIASDISGSFTSVSASLASTIAGISTDFADITNKPTLISGSNQLAGQTIEGDLTLTGALTAQTLHVQEVTSSIVYSSGSNVFGSSAGDVQQFTGSLNISGNLNLNNVGITTSKISNWDTAFGWGNHASAGYLTSFTESDPIFSAHAASNVTSTKISNWDTAFGWGNHASAGYLTSLPSHTHDDRYYTESESISLFARRDTNTNINGNLVLGNSAYGQSTAYGNSGARLFFNGSDADAQGNYYIGTNHENYGGNYSKLDLRWHTGIRIGAQQGYGGTRIYDSEDLGTVLFSVGTGDAHVRVTNNLYAPIFYDSNNTGYYANPAGSSILDGLRLKGINNQASGDDYILWIDKPNNNDWAIGVTGGYDYGLRLNMSAGHAYGIQLLSNSSERFRVNDDYAYHTSDMRSPIFYDSNDTGYFVDPASTSRINSVYIQGGVGGISNSSSYTEAAIEVRERGFGGAQDDTWATAPRIGFHWGGRVASQIALSSNGWINILNNPANGYESFRAGAIYSTGDVTAYYSDIRLKDIQGPIENAIESVKSIETFKYKNNDIAKQNGFVDDDVHIGVSAQSVEAVLPEIVKHAPFDIESKDGQTISKTGEWYKTVQYEKLVPLLIEAIKEQQVQIEELKQLINK